MSLLTRIRILPKILSVVLLLAAVAGFGGWYAVDKLGRVDAGYSRFLDNDVQAWIDLARLNRVLYNYNMLIYKYIVQTDPAAGKAVLKNIEEVGGQVSHYFDLAKQKAPQYADRLNRNQDLFKDTRGNARPIIALVERGDAAGALALLQATVEPPIAKLMADNLAIGTGFDTEIKAGSDALSATAASAQLTTATMIGVGVALALGFAVVIAHFGVARPITALAAGMRRLADGDFDVVLAGIGRKDEVGEIAGAVEAFKLKAAEKARLEAEEKAGQDRRLAEARRTEMHRLAESFESAVGHIVETVSSASTELEAAAGTLTETAESTQGLSATVAAASEQASANVQSVASAADEMSSSVGEIGRQVQESTRIAGDAVRQAEKTDGRITELSQAANRIGDVVQLITAIAEQTNLLALNATIEAARAGEAGKGFAVVAQEVKALAAQTAKATGEIASQISGMQAATQDSVSAIKEIGGTIGHIAEISAAIAAAVEEQGAATSEIARNVQQAALGTTQVASNITKVSQGAGETGSASAQVLASAHALSEESSRLRVEVDRFLAGVRAA
ncbi:methyl-accepting chemotaxis sensory transducer [Rhodovulum sp. PH10]|uniref:methyl-accepting chemotaxis protein n=1 Tax=Rhodovulum sp. PH10 TaxID=1187851 RepID=UPI00027C2E16|nr:HAMP domain-containing methyl-accepting chemotaxis protein [Rhodovulum sp. PH10]EJW11014.1 methyl-accepting chemotaxis sensory transducer [Rhodovulum sp. PH10]